MKLPVRAVFQPLALTLAIFLLGSGSVAQFIGPPSSTPSTTGAAIGFTTDTAATAQISYGTTTKGSYNSSTPVDAGGLSHTFSLTGLPPSTLIHYQINVTDALGNVASSPDETFQTMAPASISVTVSPAALSFTGATLGTATATQLFKITAVGGTVTFPAGFTFSGSKEFGWGSPGTCNTNSCCSTTHPLTAGASCYGGIQFTATATGTHKGTLTIDTSVGNTALPLTGALTVTIPPVQHSVRLNWTISITPGTTSQLVMRNGTLLATVGPTVTTYLDNTVVSGGTYTYDMESDQNGNNSVGSNTVTAVIPEP